ncbi:unnamed protein product [Leptosia nina]|uniref:Uncharacterized protein n=1 Tax=Leptosia nina TaxID=320188 RepID=A0AAV1IUK3_9NEOP
MECNENGSECLSPARGVKRKRGADGESKLRVHHADPMFGPSFPSMYNCLLQSRRVQRYSFHHPIARDPFMSNMDEISYWVFTKRAPCLYDYDKLVKKQSGEAHSSRQICGPTYPLENEVPSTKKKKKNVLDDDSIHSQNKQNVYFETPMINYKKAIINCKSISPGPNIEVNIQNTSTPKAKRPRLQKNGRKTCAMRKKVVSSTPKVEQQNLRRSLRLQQSLNNSAPFDSSLEILNDSPVNGIKRQDSALIKQKGDNKRTDVFKKESSKSKDKNLLNGEFEDYSDVSGFTANYIRSTKLAKTPRKIRRRHNRNLVEESRQNVDPERSKVVMCVTKSVNTGEHASAVLNHSTDSSQNVINLITVSDKEKSKRVNQSTSMHKFVDSPGCKKNVKKNVNGNFIHDSFQSGSSAASRYPKRGNRQIKPLSNERKENSPERIVYRTRSRKRLTEELCDQITSNGESSKAIINVGSPVLSGKVVDTLKDKESAILRKCVGRVKKSLDRRHLKRDSLRDKSGFANLFSDSDSDVESKSQKFFC